MLRLFTAFCFGFNLIHAFSGIHISLAPHQQTSHQRRSSSKLYQGKTAIETYLEDSSYNQIMAGEKAVLVDCCAAYCGPCKLIDPFLVQAAEKYSSDLEIVKFDVEAKHTGIKMEFLLQGVMPQALPSLIFFRNGQAVAKHTGALSQKELYDFIETNMSSSKAGDGAELVNIAAESKTEKSETDSAKGKISFAGMGKDDYML
jgi:thioredoxin 1